MPPAFDTEVNTSVYYDKYSKHYDTERRKGYFGFINGLEFEKILPLAAGQKVLEIGCGTGLILERTHEIANEAYGVDVSEGMVRICKAKGLKVLLGTVTKLPFEDNSFDLVYSFKVLPHVTAINKALSEIVRVTRLEGRMVLEFYNPLSFKAIGELLRRMSRKNELVYIRHDTMRNIMSYLPTGVRVVEKRGIRIFGPFALCYTLPGFGYLIRSLDRLSCNGRLKLFGGYFVVELKSDKVL